MLKREEEASKVIKKTSKRKQHKVLTQEEQYEEAKHTEEVNRESLKRLLAEEENLKKLERVKKPKYSGPRIIFHSKKGAQDTVTYSHGEFTVYKQPVVKRNVEQSAKCPVTGMSARYMDPLTKLPYANLAAFRQLRAMYAKDPKGLEKLGRAA
mmetsp:Transcript_2710/g.5001  ORF Transcript_2710/g.5001 Transcript_2710/m.5001 type:complete len:153 (+) Transcript_2710:522-980(+)